MIKKKANQDIKVKLNLTQTRAERLAKRFRDEDVSAALIKGILFILGGLALGSMLHDENEKEQKRKRRK